MHVVGRHDIKINRALAIADVGPYKATASAMLDAIPTAAIAKLTSHELAELLDAAWGLAERSKAIACRDAIDQGAVWDAAQSWHREIAA